MNPALELYTARHPRAAPKSAECSSAKDTNQKTAEYGTQDPAAILGPRDLCGKRQDKMRHDAG
jgi:hypothetical protein